VSSHTAFLLLAAAACAAPPAAYHARVATASALPAPAPAALDAHARVADYVRHAEQHGPAVAAAFERWTAALAQVPQAVSLPDPRLTLGVFLDEVETRVGPIDGRLGLQQSFPWFGTLQASGGRAFALSEAAREELEAERLAVAQRVRDALYEAAWLEAAIDVTEGHRALIAHWEEVARARYATGVGEQADVIRAQVELGTLDDRVATLRDLRRPLVARVNTELGRPAATPVPLPREALLGGGEPDDEALLAGLEDTSPVLRALRHRVDAARANVVLAQKAFAPDLAVGLEYTAVGSAAAADVSGSGDDALALTLGLELPVWREGLEAGLAGARAARRAASAALADARHRLAAELEMALYELRDAERRVALFGETLIPKGRESVGALSTAYQAGKTGFLDLIDAERVLLEFELATARAASDSARALARVERLSGVDLTEDE